jgi:hypothetical protein
MTGRPWIQPCDLATAKKKTREPPFPPPLPGELHWFDLVACDRVKPLRPYRITRLDAVRAAKWHTEFTLETPGPAVGNRGSHGFEGARFWDLLGGARLVRLSSGGVAWWIPFVSVAVNHRQTGIPRV